MLRQAHITVIVTGADRTDGAVVHVPVLAPASGWKLRQSHTLASRSDLETAALCLDLGPKNEPPS